MTMHLSRHPISYPTRYWEIVARLKQELRHHYRYGDYLPAEQQLVTRFDANRHTLRRAADQLARRGWVQRCQGAGVLVLMRLIDYPSNAQARLSQNLLEQGSDPTSEKLLSVLCSASTHVVKAFGINEGENVIHLRTLRRVDGVALCLIDHYFADLRFWPVSQTFSHGSLHDLLRDELDVKLIWARTKISARRAQVRESELLETPNVAPLLYVRTLNSRQGEQTLIEYSVSPTRADMIEFTMEHRMHLDTATRQCWMSMLAHSESQDPLARVQFPQLVPAYELIRTPETGLAQLQTRIGGIGDRFFAGDAMLTHVAVCLADGTLGHSWILDRDRPYAERCAAIDALLQSPRHFHTLTKTLIAPLEALRSARIEARRAEVNTSRVDFFILARGDNA